MINIIGVFFVIFVGLSHVNAQDCIANFPETSVIDKADIISEYEKFEDPEKQIVAEIFHLKNVGDILVQTESCEHLVWTVIFLTEENFDTKLTQEQRFNSSISKIFQIPIKPNSRFNEFKSRMLDWSKFSQKFEETTDNSYLLWRRNEDLLADIVFKQKAISTEKLRTRIDYNISL